jgi:hypothetical protein
MTKQIYPSAQGQSVDLGTIKLRNEHVRAVGNMNVNARGDILDSNNQVIDPKNRQIQRQNAQLTNIVDTPVHTSTAAARRARKKQAESEDNLVSTDTAPDVDPVIETTDTESATDTISDTAPVDDILPEPVLVAEPAPVAVASINPEPVVTPTPPVEAPAKSSGGGLAAAIARSRTIKQEKEKTLRQQSQDTPGVRKI